MKKQAFSLTNEKRVIPAVLWGEEDCSRLFVAVHGKGGHKEDEVITAFARQAVAAGCSVLSFDLPHHGQRREQKSAELQHAISDLEAVCQFACTLAEDVGVFALGFGSYLTMVVYGRLRLNWLLLAAPEVDMVRILRTELEQGGFTPAQLEQAGSLWTDTGWEIRWNHYSYAMENPVMYDACCPMDVIYGSRDPLVRQEEVERFVSCHHGRLTVAETADHEFSGQEAIIRLEQWVAAHFAEYNRVEGLVQNLTHRERAVARAARQELLEMSVSGSRIRMWLPRFFALLEHPNSRVRSRALQLIAANARWDEEGLIEQRLEEYLQHLQDEKPLTVRECIGGLPQLAEGKPRLRQKLLTALDRVQLQSYAVSMQPLLSKDMEQAREKLQSKSKKK